MAVLLRHVVLQGGGHASAWIRSRRWAGRWAWAAPRASAWWAKCRASCPTTEYHDRLSPGGYTKGMALNSAIGQGDDNVTPLQLAMVYAAIANGGTLYKPQLVQRIEDLDGQLVEGLRAEGGAHGGHQPRAPQGHRGRPGGRGQRGRRYRVRARDYKEQMKDIVVAGKTGTAQVVAIGAVRLKTHQMDFFDARPCVVRRLRARGEAGDRRGGAQRARRPRRRRTRRPRHGRHRRSTSTQEAGRRTSPPQRSNQPYVLTLPAGSEAGRISRSLAAIRPRARSIAALRPRGDAEMQLSIERRMVPHVPWGADLLHPGHLRAGHLEPGLGGAAAARLGVDQPGHRTWPWALAPR